MDRVRFGRALGYGARHAVKSLRAAAEAAGAPRASSTPSSPGVPGASRTSSARPSSAEPSSPEVIAPSSASSSAASRRTDPAAKPAAGLRTSAEQLLRASAQLRTVRHEAGKQVRRSLFSPLAKFSSVVSLQVSGTFFALVAFMMAQAAWRSRPMMQAGGGASSAARFYIVAGVGLLFAYFAVSNFLRARRRDRR